MLITAIPVNLEPCSKSRMINNTQTFSPMWCTGAYCCIAECLPSLQSLGDFCGMRVSPYAMEIRIHRIRTDFTKCSFHVLLFGASIVLSKTDCLTDIFFVFFQAFVVCMPSVEMKQFRRRNIFVARPNLFCF